MTWEPRRVTLARSWLAGRDNLLLCEACARASDAYVYELFAEDEVTTMTTSSAQLPVTTGMWVNSESRFETLRHYKIAFACPRNGSSKVYFNFAIDELEIRCHGKLGQIIAKEDLAKVRELVFPVGFDNARMSYKTLDTLRTSYPINNMDGKIQELYTRGLALGLEPYSAENISNNGELRLLAESLQREFAEAQGLPTKLLSVCPSLRKIRLLPTTTCVYWPAENIATTAEYWPDENLTTAEEDDWFAKDNCECLACYCHWVYKYLVVLTAPDSAARLWSVGDRCPERSGVDRELRLERLTISWHACVDAAGFWNPDDKRYTDRTVADWAVAASDVEHKLRDPGDDEPLYVL